MLAGLTAGLHLNDNSLRSTVPTELGNLNLYSFLWLHSNKLTGIVPTQLGRLPIITGLYLFTNKLCDEVPTEVMALSSFGYSGNLDDDIESGNDFGQVGLYLNSPDSISTVRAASTPLT